MPYYHKASGEPIRGTCEIVEATYPVTRDPETGGWTYSGGESKIFDECAEPKTNDSGTAAGEDQP